MSPEPNPAQDLVVEFLHRLEAGDGAGAAELLHPDIVWRNTGVPAVRGRRVGAMLRDMDKRGVGFAVKMRHVAADGDVVLTDRRDILTFRGFRNEFWVRGTFEVRDGLIVLWDDAFGWGDLLRSSVVGLVRAPFRR